MQARKQRVGVDGLFCATVNEEAGRAKVEQGQQDVEGRCLHCPLPSPLCLGSFRAGHETNIGSPICAGVLSGD